METKYKIIYCIFIVLFLACFFWGLHDAMTAAKPAVFVFNYFYAIFNMYYVLDVFKTIKPSGFEV